MKKKKKEDLAFCFLQRSAHIDRFVLKSETGAEMRSGRMHFPAQA